MKDFNGELPAYPVSCVDSEGYMTGTQAQISGLTKREIFAMSAMQSLIKVYWEDVDSYPSASAMLKCLSESSVEHADALLAELNRNNNV